MVSRDIAVGLSLTTCTLELEHLIHRCAEILRMQCMPGADAQLLRKSRSNSVTLHTNNAVICIGAAQLYTILSE